MARWWWDRGEGGEAYVAVEKVRTNGQGPSWSSRSIQDSLLPLPEKEHGQFSKQAEGQSAGRTPAQACILHVRYLQWQLRLYIEAVLILELHTRKHIHLLIF